VISVSLQFIDREENVKGDLNIRVPPEWRSTFMCISDALRTSVGCRPVLTYSRPRRLQPRGAVPTRRMELVLRVAVPDSRILT
jgi:hypothetical protein